MNAEYERKKWKRSEEEKHWKQTRMRNRDDPFKCLTNTQSTTVSQYQHSTNSQHKFRTSAFFSFYLDFNKSTHCFVSSHFGRMRCYFVLWLGWFFFYYSISLSSSGECVSVSLLSGTKHLSFYSVASIHWSLPWNASNRSFEMPNLHSHLFIYYFQFRFERIEWAWPLCFFPSILNSRSKIQ